VACELTGARYAAIGVLDERREELERFITRGIDEEARQEIGALPRGQGVLGTLIHDPKPLRLANVGAHRDSWGFTLGHPPMKTFLGVPILRRGKAFGNLYLTEKASGEFDESDEEAMLVLADWVAIAMSNAEAHHAVQRRRDELERAVHGLEATTEIARAIGSETRLERVLELVVKRSRALVSARGTVVLMQQADEAEVAAVAGELAPELLGRRIPLAYCVSGRVMRGGRPERVRSAPSPLRGGLAAIVGARAALYVPLMYRGRPLGVLCAFDPLDGEADFDPDDEWLMEAFAASAAVAIATAHDVAAGGLRRSIEATERERARWARELHDETLQELAAVAILLSSARRQGSPGELPAAIDEAVEHARSAVAALRGLIDDLRPAALDQLGLQAALERLAGRTQELSAIEIALGVDLDYEQGRRATRLPASIEDAVFRVVQEALTNVTKHSGAAQAWITVQEANGGVTLLVRDDGQGFSEPAADEGFGLLGMRERVSLLGGVFTVESAPGSGTTVSALLPAAASAIA
jgi:two-component system, NarL family, sensor histidine kinase DevS